MLSSELALSFGLWLTKTLCRPEPGRWLGEGPTSTSAYNRSQQDRRPAARLAFFFQQAILRILIIPQAQKHRSPQLRRTTVRSLGPFRILDLGYQFGLDPAHFPQRLDFTVKRILLGLDLFQQTPDFLQRSLIESASGLPHVNQPAFSVIQPQHNRPEMRAASFRFGEPSDHALLPVFDLDLQPLAAAAFFIKTLPLLGQNAFQPLLVRHIKQGLSLLRIMIGVTHRIARGEQ